MYIKDYSKPIVSRIHKTILYITSDEMKTLYLLPNPIKILLSIPKYRNKHGIYVTDGSQYVTQNSVYQNIGITVDFSKYNIQRCK